MKTIVEPKNHIVKLWGKQKVKDEYTYRMMRYVLRVDHDGKVLLHNAVTGQFVLLTDDEAEWLSRLPTAPTESIRELIENHFLVPKDYDEYRSVNQLRKIYQSRSTGNAINHFVILPTTFCNAHCFYCYESDYPRVHMTEETAQRLIEYIATQCQGKRVQLSWFGGEPLVGISRIDQICQGLKERDIPYASSMISNGYLFNEDLVNKAVKLWKLETVQITLDGTENVYNQVKSYVNTEGNPYQRVLDNIDLLARNNVRVTIRLNIDFYNKDDISTLIEELGERYAGNKNIAVYLNMLFNHQGYEPVHHSQDERIELIRIISDYTKRLKDFKIGHERRTIPSLEFSQCMADNAHTIEIQPDGSFCRCEHENINDNYGNIWDGVLDPEKPLIWKESIERSEYCPNCCVYPACYLLRRCMNADTPCVESVRKWSVESHIEQLLSVYQKSLKEDQNERVCSS